MIGFGVVALSADFLNDTFTSLLDLIPEELDDLLEPVLAPFEVVSLVLSGFSWLASFPASRVEEGGYPYNICLDENNVNKHDNEKEYWERVMWGWRTFVLGFDIVYVSVAGIATGLAPNNKIFKIQRLRRATEATVGFTVVFTLVDIGLTGRYLGTLTRDDKVGREISNEMLALLPTLFCWLRMTGSGYALLGQFAINVISTGATTGLNAKILTDNVRDLD